MLATADAALGLTLAAGGSHGVAGYLPQQEVDQFLKRAQGTGATADFAANKLDESNVGFQMLKQAGWAEGQGLGAASSGITQPVAVGQPAGDSAGVGMAGDDSNEETDEFDQYRKRMMLAYRFRPNPLNNPRRDYY
mmetsp:Transcript_23243/g.52406  ORF Transcript_23243/g.52406 Transcript_23243/m.52406 type:complete len:136 (-) Transcript_23243:589-996(-)